MFSPRGKLKFQMKILTVVEIIFFSSYWHMSDQNLIKKQTYMWIEYKNKRMHTLFEIYPWNYCYFNLNTDNLQQRLLYPYWKKINLSINTYYKQYSDNQTTTNYNVLLNYFFLAFLMWYHLIHSCGDKGFITFPRKSVGSWTKKPEESSNSLTSRTQSSSHYTTGTPSKVFIVNNFRAFKYITTLILEIV